MLEPIRSLYIYALVRKSFRLIEYRVSPDGIPFVIVEVTFAGREEDALAHYYKFGAVPLIEGVYGSLTSYWKSTWDEIRKWDGR